MASHLPAKAAKALANLSHQETRLNLARCGLADWHLSLIDWSKLNHIRSIDLSGNSLCSIPVKVFEQWSWVEELSLYKNQIAEIPCGALLFLRKVVAVVFAAIPLF
jgi:Leucine-rich repeat (LRR) protein